MTEASTPQPSPSSEQLPWGISYLREDIQDLRQEMRDNTQEVRQEVQGVRQEMRQEIQDLRQEIGAVHRHIDSRFAWTITTVIALGGLMVTLLGVVVAVFKT